ncbi:MAG: hypothetical protein LLF76_07920 [Planctomycetaceae bacterium]|nr:hypothetical protein [Planctomycetaceae bacterium]
MWNIFENSWLLLTIGGFALVGASIYRQIKPEHGRWPLLVPLFIILLGFGLDAAVSTDYESIERIIRSCRRAAIGGDAAGILACVSPNYSDSIHGSKDELAASAEALLRQASVEKVRTQSHVITIDGKRAASKFEAAVHLGAQNKYTAGVTMVFVGLEFNYEKIGKNWFIQRVEVKSVNFQPMDWGDVH